MVGFLPANITCGNKVKPSHFWARILLGLWAALVSTGLLFAGVWHYAPIPASIQNTDQHREGSAAGWSMTHFVSADCACSAKIAEHLEQRRRELSVDETVVIIGTNALWKRHLESAGFRVVEQTADSALSEHGIEGAPWLIIRSGEAAVYSGGYSRRNPAAATKIDDLALLKAARSGTPVPALPAYGCATSARLKHRLDPFGIKSLLSP